MSLSPFVDFTSAYHSRGHRLVTDSAGKAEKKEVGKAEGLEGRVKRKGIKEKVRSSKLISNQMVVFDFLLGLLLE